MIALLVLVLDRLGRDGAGLLGRVGTLGVAALLESSLDGDGPLLAGGAARLEMAALLLNIE